MSNPYWFIIASRWKKEMGEVGVTLSFLVGSLRRVNEGRDCEGISSSSLINDIISHPVLGYVAEISLCPNISAPVISVVKLNDKKRRMAVKSSFFSEETGDESLILTSNIHSRQGYDSADKDECLRKLIEATNELVNSGQYSRVRVEGELGKYVYGSFSQREIKFIDSIRE